MYKIIGTDGKQYGPVTAEQLKEWIAQGRVNAQTLVQADGMSDWRPLAAYPELALLAAPQALSAQPAPQASPGDQVRGPAIALIVTAGLGMLNAAGGIVLNALSIGGFQFLPQTGDQTERALTSLLGGFGIIQSVVHLALGVLILFGALRMMKLRSYTLAMTSTVLAMVPCLSPCCILGLPLGIWALVVLNKPEVKGAFN